MPGARLILNTRYFHIVRAGEQTNGKHVMTKDAAIGLVNLCWFPRKSLVEYAILAYSTRSGITEKLLTPTTTTTGKTC